MKRARDPFKPVVDNHVHLATHTHTDTTQRQFHYIACTFQGWVYEDGATADPHGVDCPDCRGTSRWRCAVDDMATILEPLIIVTDDETAGCLDTHDLAVEMADAIRAAGYVKRAEKKREAGQCE